MKAEHVKAPENTEVVSSHPGEKGHWSQKRHRNTPCAGEKRRADWKKGLQICAEGSKSRKRPALVVGKNPNGKYQMKALILVAFFCANVAFAQGTNIYLPVADGTVFDGGGVNTGDYLVTAPPPSEEQGDLQFASFNSALYSSVLLELNSYGVPPLFGNPVLVYGYDNASGTLSQSDFNAGTYLGAWTFPANLLPGQEEFFDVTTFVQSEQGSYFGFDLRSDGVDNFSSTAINYGIPPELIAIEVPEPSVGVLTAIGGLLIGARKWLARRR